MIAGPSGAGKTTVLNILGGMDTCDGGEVLVDGERVDEFQAKRLTTYRRNEIGFVFQFYNLVQNLTAKENVELALQICREPLDAEQVLTDVGLAGRMGNFPHLPQARAVLPHHSMLMTSAGASFFTDSLTFPFLMRITRSAIGAIAELCVITITVIPFSRQVSCKSFNICFPVL